MAGDRDGPSGYCPSDPAFASDVPSKDGGTPARERPTCVVPEIRAERGDRLPGIQQSADRPLWAALLCGPPSMIGPEPMATKGSRSVGARTKLKEASIDATAMMWGALGRQGSGRRCLGSGLELRRRKRRGLNPSLSSPHRALPRRLWTPRTVAPRPPPLVRLLWPSRLEP